MTRHTVALYLAALLAGCGDIDRPDPKNLGEACIAYAEAGCARIIECGLAPPSDADECESIVVKACCRDDGACQSPAAASGDELQACVDSFADFDCEAIAERDPPECLII